MPTTVAAKSDPWSRGFVRESSMLSVLVLILILTQPFDALRSSVVDRRLGLSW